MTDDLENALGAFDEPASPPQVDNEFESALSVFDEPLPIEKPKRTHSQKIDDRLIMEGGFNDEWLDSADAKIAAAIHGVAQGVSLNSSDEIEAGLKTGMGLFGDYDQEVESVRARIKALSDTYPITTIVSELLGGITGGLALLKSGATFTGKAATKGMAARLGAASADGAIIGGAHGFNSGEDLEERARGAAVGTVVGGVTGPLAEGLVGGLSGAKRRLTGEAATTNHAHYTDSTHLSDSFEVPLLRSEATGSIGQAATEDQLRSRGLLKDFDVKRTEALDNAVTGIQRKISGGDNVIDSANSGPEHAIEALQNKALSLKKKGGDLIEKAGESNLEFQAGHFTDMPRYMKSFIDNESVILDPVVTPVASQAMKRVEDVIATMPEGATGISLKGVNQLSKSLNKLKTDPRTEDYRALQAIRKSLKNWTDNGIDQVLYSGDESALKMLKEGNKTYSEYLRLTRPKSGDDAGRVIKKMIEDDISPIEAGNYIFGSSVISPPGRAVRVTKALKSELGEDSAEFSKIRQSHWLRLTRGQDGQLLSPDKLRSNLSASFGKDGRSSGLARELYGFSDAHRIQQFRQLLETIKPQKEAVNSSQSGNRIWNKVRDLSSSIAGLGAMSTDAGLGGGIGVYLGARLFGKAVDKVKVGTATNPRVRPPRQALPVAVGTTPIAVDETKEYVGGSPQNIASTP